MPPKSTTSSQMPRYDQYAWARCVNCYPHICYADDEPDGSCRFCSCTSHTPPAQAGQQAPEDTAATEKYGTGVDL